MRPGLGHKRSRRAASREIVVPAMAPAPPPARPEERLPLRQLRPGIPATVAITGSSSNAGKTWLCEQLLRALATRGIAATALKVTRTHLGVCPRAEVGCGVCDSLVLPFRVITERELLDIPRKDTGRCYAAGAASVVWLLVQPAHLRRGLLAALEQVPDAQVLVAEGNSFHDHAEVDVSAMVLGGASQPKPSALPLFGRTKVFVAGQGEVALPSSQVPPGQVVRDPGEALGEILRAIENLRTGAG